LAGVTPGQVIVLNGTSSSGKTTLALQLQARFAAAGECWIVIAIDDFFPKLPADWFRIGKHVGKHAEQGMAFELVDGEVERRVGPIGEQMLAAYRGAVGCAARVGLNVIVDEVLLSQADWDAWNVELDGLDVFWVQVQVDLEVVEARERERGDRMIGIARSQHGIVHRYATYDARVDTGTVDPETAVDAILAVRNISTGGSA
jgi:chloramphenicol 3-O phosphotransferase